MDTQQLAQELGNLTIPQVVALTKQLEEMWGVKAVPQASQGTPVPPAPPPDQQQTEFTVVFVSAGGRKIDAIKVVREVTGLGLKEAKDFVEAGFPKTLKDGVSKDEASALQKKFLEVGATVEVK